LELPGRGGMWHPMGWPQVGIGIPAVHIVIDAAPNLESLAVRIEAAARLPISDGDPSLELGSTARCGLNRLPFAHCCRFLSARVKAGSGTHRRHGVSGIAVSKGRILSIGSPACR